MRKRTWVSGAISAAVLAAFALSLTGVLPVAAATGAAPHATLGIWISAEDSGSYSTVPGQHPNIANYYLAWGQAFPTSFIHAAEAAGATPFIEIEPWHAGPNWDETPSMVDIGNNRATDCGPDGTSSCEAWLDSIGRAVRALGKPMIFTFAHEFNVSGQYPWSYGDSEGTTPAQWIKAWDTVQADINSNGGSQHAWFMWVPNADTGGSTVPFAAWWPGKQHVAMVGIDGYPQTQYGLDTFQQVFGRSFAEMKALTPLPIFISETDLAPETGSGGTQTVTQFVKAALAAGATGLLQFQDGSPPLSSQQWSELDAALPGAPRTSPSGIEVRVSGSHVTLTWRGVGRAAGYEVQVALPKGTLWKDSRVTATHVTYVAPAKGTYHYKIRAYNAEGDGPWSAVKTFKVTT
jgi:Fibronectin type III domain/Glycosyl hydrolase family 26